MNPNLYYDYYQLPAPTNVTNYDEANNSYGHYNEAYYNNYWYSRSDCSSSSIDTSESTSPISNRQQYNSAYYLNNQSYCYYPTNVNYNELPQSKKCTIETNDEVDEEKTTNDKFNTEILPLLGDSTQACKRRMRTAFTSDQRIYLLKIFEKTIYPNKDEVEQLSQELKVTSTIIQTWFKNMRAKKKKVTKVY